MSEIDLFLSRRLTDLTIKHSISKPIHYDTSPIIKLCPDQFNVLNHKLLLMKGIGSGSEYGEAFKSCIPYNKDLNTCDNNGIILSTKKIPLSRKQQKNINRNITDNKNKLVGLEPYEENDVSMEILSMYLSYVIIMNNIPICPNLPLMYDWFYCDNIRYINDKLNNRLNIETEYKTLLNNLNNTNMINSYSSFINKLEKSDKIVDVDDIYINKFLTENQFINKIIRTTLNDQITNSCLLVLNEYADEGDLKHWLIKQERSTMEWLVMYFQVFAGLYALQKHFDLVHYDLHWGNVLVHNIKKYKKYNPHKTDEFLLYNINNDYYKIPNVGYLFTLWDFGLARIFSKNLHAKKFYYTDNSDMNPYSEDYYRISHAVYWYQGGNGPNKPTGKETNREIHGTTPNKLKNVFYKTVQSLYDKKTPLEKIFPVLFSEFIINENEYNKLLKISHSPYIINDTVKPSVSPVILNNTKYYKEYLSVSELQKNIKTSKNNNQSFDYMITDSSNAMDTAMDTTSFDMKI